MYCVGSEGFATSKHALNSPDFLLLASSNLSVPLSSAEDAVGHEAVDLTPGPSKAPVRKVKRQKPNREAKSPLDAARTTVVLIMEYKLDSALKALAQTLGYLLTARECWATRLACVWVGTQYSRIILVDDGLVRGDGTEILLETNDEARWGNSCPLADLAAKPAWSIRHLANQLRITDGAVPFEISLHEQAADRLARWILASAKIAGSFDVERATNWNDVNQLSQAALDELRKELELEGQQEGLQSGKQKQKGKQKEEALSLTLLSLALPKAHDPVAGDINTQKAIHRRTVARLARPTLANIYNKLHSENATGSTKGRSSKPIDGAGGAREDRPDDEHGRGQDHLEPDSKGDDKRDRQDEGTQPTDTSYGGPRGKSPLCASSPHR